MKGLRYLNTMLTILAVLLTLQLWTTWNMAPADMATEAHAQGIPDAGAQRKQMIDELKLVNKKVEELKGLLTSGKVRVTVLNAGGEEDAGR